MTIKHCFHISVALSLVVKKLQKDRKINFKTCLGREPQFETVWLTFSSFILSFVRNGFPVPTSFPIGPFIRRKIRRVLNKTRTFRINGTFRLK